MEERDVYAEIQAFGEEPGNVGDAIKWQMKRVQIIREEYLSLPGGAGAFAAAGMQSSIHGAIDALANGDVLEILFWYESLKNWEL